MKVLFLTNIPSPYRVHFFDELGKYCDLQVLFERATSSERDKSWGEFRFENFNGIILDGICFGRDKAFSMNIIKYLKQEYDYIVIANSATPLGIFAIMYLKCVKRKYYIEGDGAQYIKRNWLKECIKKIVIKDADGYFSSSHSLDYYYSMYGAEYEKIHRYPFSSIFDSDIQSINEIEIKKVEARQQLKISREKKIVLAVGQFDYRKGFDVLIRSMAGVTEADCYIVGGKITEDYEAIIKQEKIGNIKFRPFMRKEQLSAYFMAADMFVLPTRYDAWGLVINEAMAYGLPVISTDKCVAALELIENNVNGFVIPVDDKDMLASRINLLIKDEALLKRIQSNNLEKIRAYTIETMAKRHMEVFEQNIRKN